MLTYPQNLHTHGTFCDGKYEYEETVKSAIELNMMSVGFSGHAYTEFDSSCCMSKEGTELYKKRISELKEKYRGIIDIYCGVEFDLFSDDDLSAYDYVIGDVHYLKIGDEYCVIDYSDPATLEEIINVHFGGDGLRCAKAYYETIVGIASLPRCDIAGHFDLITKHLERKRLFDDDDPLYRKYALEAVTAVSESVKIFEINVGSIARGYRSIPYPAPFILRRIKELGCGVVISSDCHDISYLNTNFDIGISLAKECGFNEVLVLTDNGFKGLKI